MRGQWRNKLGLAVRSVVPAAMIGLTLGGVGLPPAAEAQFLGWDWGSGWGGDDPRLINQRISQHGFRLIAPLQRNGAVFLADVLDRRGRRERLIVAAADGQILQRFFLDNPRLPGYVPRNAGQDEIDMPERPTLRADRDPRLVPPGVIPGVGMRPGAETNADLGASTEESDIEPVMPRPLPKVIRAPRPRIVDRAPDAAPASAEPTSAVPGEAVPITPRPKLGEPHTAAPGETTASRAAEPPARPAVAPAPVPPDTGTSAKLTDPLKIPSDQKPAIKPAAADPARKPAVTAGGAAPAPNGVPLGTQSAPRIVSGSITGAPSAARRPAPADVPVAPLD